MEVFLGIIFIFFAFGVLMSILSKIGNVFSEITGKNANKRNKELIEAIDSRKYEKEDKIWKKAEKKRLKKEKKRLKKENITQAVENT